MLLEKATTKSLHFFLEYNIKFVFDLTARSSHGSLKKNALSTLLKQLVGVWTLKRFVHIPWIFFRNQGTSVSFLRRRIL